MRISLIALAAFTLTATLAAQPAVQVVPVHIVSTVERISTLYDITHSKKVGKHNVYICNDGAAPVRISPERVLMALNGLPALRPDEAAALMRNAYNHNPKLDIVRYIEYGALGATIIGAGGLVAISSKGVAALAAGTSAAHMFGDKIKGEVPSLEPFLAQMLSSDPIQLNAAGAPGDCTTKVIFTGVIKDVRGFDVTIQVPSNATLTSAPLPSTLPPPTPPPPTSLPSPAARISWLNVPDLCPELAAE